MSKAAVRSGLAVAFLLALTACSGTNQAQPVSESVSGVASDATPAQENTTAVEQPLPPRDGNPGLSVATLPIGGPSEASSANNGAQCVHVNWILSTSGDFIPAGLSVEITGVVFEPDVYLVADNGCQGPPCLGKVFRSSDRACDLPIRPRVASATGRSDTEEVSLSAKGRILCDNYGGELCKTFAAAVRGEPQTITLALPVPPDPGPGSTTGSGAATTPAMTPAMTGASPGG